MTEQEFMKKLRSAEFAEKVARILKERRLRREPGMDEFAVRLNRQPTYEEIERTKMVLNIIANNLIGE